MAVTKSGDSLKLKDSLKLGLCIKYVSSFIIYINDFNYSIFESCISSHLISSFPACIPVHMLAVSQ